MKMTTSPGFTLASLLGISLLSLSAAGAQTITQHYSNSGPADGNLAAIGFDSYQWAEATGYDTTGTQVGVQGGTLFNTNWSSINYVFSAPTAPAGYELTGVDLSLFIYSMVPINSTTTFDIYAGLDRTGGVVGHFDLTHPVDINTFQDISIPVSALAGGFSLGYATNSISPPNFVTYTEGVANTALHPEVTFTFSAIPEPSVAVLGALGGLALLRRRRA